MNRFSNDTILKVNNLNVSSKNINRSGSILTDINITVSSGQIVGIEGDSGSGKTVLAKSVMGLIEAPLYIKSGEIMLCGQNILHLSDSEFSRLRGSELSMILQNPMSALDPLMKIGDQISEALLLHENISGKSAKERALKMLEKVGFNNPADRYNNYPYEMSGGQCQRVMIAMAMINHPRLLIADEPTTSLDVTNEKQILSLIKSICREYDTGVILISHNIKILRENCDCVYTINDGRITGLFEHAENITLPSYNSGKLHEPVGLCPGDPVVSCRKLCKDYRLPSGQVIHALSNVSLDIFRGECLGLAGDSGSGKTTLARTIAGLQTADSGSITRFVENPQMILQDPYSSLDPRMKIKDIIAEPMRIARRKSRTNIYLRSIQELLEIVRLPECYMNYYPYQLSGGQRQKVSIARAISTTPELIICDESVSALDARIQYRILDLLIDLKEKYDMTYLFISHDVSVIEYISDRIIKMENGKIIG